MNLFRTSQFPPVRVSGRRRSETGRTIGATSETGSGAVEAVYPIQDLHITLLPNGIGR